MPNEMTELEKRNVLRLSNDESNKITKECIQTALIHLMATEDIQKITVSKIVQKAGVSRTAFYNNYTSKEDVLSSLSANLQEELIRLTREVFSEDKRYDAYVKVFQKIKDDSLHFNMLLNSGVQNGQMRSFSALVSEHYGSMNSKIRYLVFAWGGMIRSILLDWFYNGMKESVYEMAQLCTEMGSLIASKIRKADPVFMDNASTAVMKKESDQTSRKN